MAISVIKTSYQLGSAFVLTPERYNPNRRMKLNNSKNSMILSDIVTLSSETITQKQIGKVEVLTINTADARGGYLKVPQKKEQIKSNKKRLNPGDVIISRLRPYLQQVAYVDEVGGYDDILAASTEFYVLRSRTKDSIAFLVPFLLSDPVQKVFANSVEGSQHPRFKEDDILNLPLPKHIFEKRTENSKEIIQAIEYYRKYESIMNTSTLSVSEFMKKELQ